MKPILFLFLLLTAFVPALRAQDDMILRTGEEVKAKVLEVGLTTIKYKKTDNPTGPVYTISKAEVFMIKYENGTKDVFTSAAKPAPDAKSPMNSGAHTPAPADYNRLRHLAVKNIAGGAVMIAVGAPVLLTGLTLTGIGLSGMGSYNYNNNYPYNDNSGNAAVLVVGGVLTAAGVVLEVMGPLTLKKGIRYRRMAKDAKPALGFTPINNPLLDRYTRAMNRETLGSITLIF